MHPQRMRERGEGLNVVLDFRSFFFSFFPTNASPPRRLRRIKIPSPGMGKKNPIAGGKRGRRMRKNSRNESNNCEAGRTCKPVERVRMVEVPRSALSLEPSCFQRRQSSVLDTHGFCKDFGRSVAVRRGESTYTDAPVHSVCKGGAFPATLRLA